ncbi:MAG: pyrroline-5-carboxylate reductase [Lachnospiraceae bacterium]|nr:pyrroline-5-carboxylate reductase [Lachnospiraceae bacterium]
MKIGFIGLGNMAKAIIGGILQSGLAVPSDICGSAKTAATRESVAREFGIDTAGSNAAVAADSDVLFLAVKPVFFPGVIEEIKDSVREGALIISVVAGKTIGYLAESFGRKDLHIVRTMPNTPALVGEGCTGLCFDSAVTEEERDLACALCGSFGKAIVVEERLMDVVGAVSGSSPAFVFLFLEALADGAVAGGMPRKQAYEFAGQAVLGSAKLLLETGKHPGELKDMVCSPGGTTIEGVKALEEGGLRAAVMNAMEATIEKTRKL